MGKFGWDLPPGCRVSDIPGNSSEDERWEGVYDNFWDKERLTKTHKGTLITEQQYVQLDSLFNAEISEVIDTYVIAAIEYGMEIADAESKINHDENKHYEECYHEELMSKAINKIERLVNNKLLTDEIVEIFDKVHRLEDFSEET